MAFRFSVDDMSPGEHYALPGMWATDTILAKGINRTLAGYPIGADAAPGKKQEKWTVRLDGPICGYTQHVTVDHRTAVLFKASDREGAYCNHVVLVDLDDGTEVWERTFPVSTAGHSVSSPQRTPGVTLAHDTVAVTWGGGTSAFGLADGRSKWRTTVTGSCRDDGAAGGAGLLVRRACWKEGTPSSDIWDGTTYSVRKVDPATGATVWTYSAAKGVRDLVVPSAEPPVIGVSAGDTGLTELISLDAEGHNRATVSLQSGTYVGECSSSDYLVIDDCPTIAVGDGQVFLRSKDQTDQGTSNWIIGFDLATGTTTRKFDSGPHALLRPVRMSGHQLLALRTSEDGISPHALLSLDPATGGERPYLYFGLPVEAAPSPRSTTATSSSRTAASSSAPRPRTGPARTRRRRGSTSSSASGARRGSRAPGHPVRHARVRGPHHTRRCPHSEGAPGATTARPRRTSFLRGVRLRRHPAVARVRLQVELAVPGTQHERPPLRLGVAQHRVRVERGTHRHRAGGQVRDLHPLLVVLGARRAVPLHVRDVERVQLVPLAFLARLAFLVRLIGHGGSGPSYGSTSCTTTLLGAFVQVRGFPPTALVRVVRRRAATDPAGPADGPVVAGCYSCIRPFVYAPRNAPFWRSRPADPRLPSHGSSPRHRPGALGGHHRS